MCCQVEALAAGGARRLVLALLVACGGLAEDGRVPPAASSTGDPAQDTSLTSTEPRAGAKTGSGAEESEASAGVAASVAGAPGVGQACGLRGEETGQSFVVGEVELHDDARCGAGNFCLLRAQQGTACRAGATFAAAECAAAADDDEVVPVPPPVAAEPAWAEGVCTCRCDGSDSRSDECACPRGMRCGAVIPSAGLNAAARDYVGSYCVF